MHKETGQRAFSLMELLIALAVLALAAAIVVPRYLNMQTQAQDAVATSMADELNHVYGNWKSSGGVITGTPTLAGILTMLSQTSTVVAPGIPTTPGVNVAAIPLSDGYLYDAGASSAIRYNPPNSMILPPTSNGIAAIAFNGIFIIYKSGSDSFTGVSQTTAITGGTPPDTYLDCATGTTYDLTGGTYKVHGKGRGYASP